MAWYQALQRKDGKWDYTCSNSAGTFPIGYCHAFQLLKHEDKIFPVEMCARENARIAPFAAKYHDCGHETSIEAEICYREYELDQRLKFEENETGEDKKKCRVCQEWTTGYGHLMGDGNKFWPLCDQHRNRESVEAVWPKPNENDSVSESLRKIDEILAEAKE